MVKLDEIDKVILTHLGINSAASAPQISSKLTEINKSKTDRAVLQRIARLQEKKIIQGYTTILHPDMIEDKTSVLLLLKFKTSAEPSGIKKLDIYLSESKYCLSAARLEATLGFDYMCSLVFDTERQFLLQFLVLRRVFRDLIFDHKIIKTRIVKMVPYTFSFDHSLEACKKRIPSAKLGLREIKESKKIEEKLQQYIDDLARSLDLKHVRLWFMEVSTDKLAPVLHSYTPGTGPAEYEYVSRSKINIELILETTTMPVLSNDIARDFNISIANELISEGVKSYGGYPLVHENQIIGILEIFSDRDFSPAEFELWEVVSSELSNEIITIRFGTIQ
jgi:DNA-binding Lrp family transcriptional regulator